MKNPTSEEENIIKYINLFRLKKELNYIAIENIRSLFRLEKETKVTKDRLLRDVKKEEEHQHEKEEENCYKSTRVNNFWSKNYIEYGSNGDRNKAPSIKEYLNKTRP